jgi:MFS family permease
MTAAVATGLSWNLASFLLFRFLTGAGIGGEYAAINSTIQELIPCRYRGWTDLAINGSFWVGAALGAGGSVVLLDPHLFAVDIGWRLCFMIGAALSIVIFVMRLWLPESPRWLLTHGRAAEAAAVVAGIERRFEAAGQKLPAAPLARARFRGRNVGLREVLYSLFWVHRQRALVGLSLMTAQAFFYNAIFFTYALVLTDFYGVPADRIGWYILPFAAGNFLGPLLLGHFFDSIGRKPMIAGTYILSGLLLAVSGYLFQQGQLSASGQTIAWMIVFFFASAAASSAYLTVSETFPLEVRAMAIAVFYAVGTGLGGIAGPLLFGRLIETGSRQEVFIGYLIGAALMLGAAVVLLIWGVAAERKPLETVCRPLTLAE